MPEIPNHVKALLTPKVDKVTHVKAQKQSREHHCHWPGCPRSVPPAMWGCYEHWMRLPKHLRDKVWAAYRPGQEIDMRPSREYLDVAEEVQTWIRTHCSQELGLACVACGGSGRASDGSICYPCYYSGRIS